MNQPMKFGVTSVEDKNFSLVTGELSSKIEQNGKTHKIASYSRTSDDEALKSETLIEIYKLVLTNKLSRRI
jgi:hypothetical protein